MNTKKMPVLQSHNKQEGARQEKFRMIPLLLKLGLSFKETVKELGLSLKEIQQEMQKQCSSQDR